MANQIRLKRASGSDPGASDLVLGEPAVRTDTGEIFLKKDDGSIAKVAGGIDDGDKGDITVSNDGGTFTIDNDAVTYAKIQNVSATNRILGRDSSGAGVIEEITPANLRTMINVENGATADQSASEIVALIADQTIAPSTIDMEDDEKIKLGAGDDLQIFHGSNISTIEDSYGDLRIKSDLIRIQRQAGGENYLMMTEGGSVQVYHDGTERFRTGSGGNTTFGTDAGGSDHRGRLYFKTEGGTVRALFDPLAQKFQHYDNTNATFGNDHDLSIYHDSSNSSIVNATGVFTIKNSGAGKLQLMTQGAQDVEIKTNNELSIKCNDDGAVEAYFDATKRFETSSYGSVTTGVHSISNGILETKATIATSHTLTADYNALAVSPTINNGVTVTVPSGAVWAIV